MVEQLLEWYSSCARILPWREDPSAYRVWVSEIMLQQTRVEAVKPYFFKFIEALPDVKALALCPEDALMKLWEGLGYYNRVRNMQKAAKIILVQYGGELPAKYEELLKLPGIGPYTAGAIASIAFGMAVPAVDGNVLRVLSRLYGNEMDIAKDETKRYWESVVKERLEQMTENRRQHQNRTMVSTFNQALMELGAVICIPNGEPNCAQCPWQDICMTKQKGNWDVIPVKSKKKPRRIEHRTVLLIRSCYEGERRYVLQKRPNKGLLAGLYEFPNVLGSLPEEEVLTLVKTLGVHPVQIKKLPQAKHIFTHMVWHMRGYLIYVDELHPPQPAITFVSSYEMKHQYAIPSAFDAYLKIALER